jgi:signal transduction histidine kinase
MPKRSGLSPAGQFLAASLLVIIAGMAGAGWWLSTQIEQRVLSYSSDTASIYLRSLVAPMLEGMDGDHTLPPDQAATLTYLLNNTPISEQVVAFVVWGPEGQVLYSTEADQIGHVFTPDEALERAWRGETTWEFSANGEDEHQPLQSRSKMLLTSYTPVRDRESGAILGVAEFYQHGDALQAGIAEGQRATWLVIIVMGGLMYLSLAGFVGKISNTIVRQQDALAGQVTQLKALLNQIETLHERVRRATSRSAALNERFQRRLSAELHDGPAQYLGASLLHLDRVASFYEGDPAHAVTIEHLDSAQISLSQALEELRAIAGGLGMPQLATLSLADTVRRAAGTHERRTHTEVALHLDALPAGASLAAKITLYRIVQESLTNAFRHAGGAGQRVRVWADSTMIFAEISDAGPGFTTRANDEGRLGLVGMRERVESLGGSFAIYSEPGRGTSVWAAIPIAGADDELVTPIQSHEEVA